MISGAAQADVCLLMVPADGNFTTAIQKGDHKAGEIQGQTRQHARLLNLLGVRQLIVGINKMDADTAGYKQVGAGCGGGWGRGEESRAGCFGSWCRLLMGAVWQLLATACQQVSTAAWLPSQTQVLCR